MMLFSAKTDVDQKIVHFPIPEDWTADARLTYG